MTVTARHRPRFLLPIGCADRRIGPFLLLRYIRSTGLIGRDRRGGEPSRVSASTLTAYRSRRAMSVTKEGDRGGADQDQRLGRNLPRFVALTRITALPP